MAYEGWIVTRDVRRPFHWEGNVCMMTPEAWYEIQDYRACVEPYTAFMLRLAGYGNPLLIGRITQLNFFHWAFYNGNNLNLD